MPRKAKVPCSHRGCRNLVEPGTGGYCEEHKTIRHQHYNKTRTDKKEIAFYKQKRWLSVRKAALYRDQGLCVVCKEPAVLVDHIIEVKDGGAKYSLENLQSMCHKCHAIKTQKVASQK